MCKVLLNTIDRVKRFVNISSDFEIGATLRSGRYVIDAKSILGIFGLNLSQPLELNFDISDDGEKELADYYMTQLAEFLVYE